MEDKKKKQEEKKTPEAPDLKLVKEMPPMPQGQTLRMIVIETNGQRAEVRACTMQGQELLNILNDVANLARQEIANAPPLHPPAPKIQPPAPSEAQA